MTTPSAVQKMCCVCHQDVSTQKRTKDTRGNYYCAACWAQKSRQAQPVPVRPSPPPPSQPLPQSADRDSPPPAPATPRPRPAPAPVPLAYAGVRTSQVSADRLVAARIANLAGIVNFIFSALVPGATYLYFSVMDMPMRPVFYFQLGIVFAFYLISGFIIWGLGRAIPGGKSVSVVLALVFAILAILLNLGTLALVIISVVYGAEIRLALAPAALAMVMASLYGKLLYHALLTLRHGAP